MSIYYYVIVILIYNHMYNKEKRTLYIEYWKENS